MYGVMYRLDGTLLEKCVSHFTNKYGCRPTKLYIRPDEIPERIPEGLTVVPFAQMLRKHCVLSCDDRPLDSRS